MLYAVHSPPSIADYIVLGEEAHLKWEKIMPTSSIRRPMVRSALALDPKGMSTTGGFTGHIIFRYSQNILSPENPFSIMEVYLCCQVSYDSKARLYDDSREVR